MKDQKEDKIRNETHDDRRDDKFRKPMKYDMIDAM